MISLDDINKPDFFDCKHCHEPIPFLLAVVLHGVVLLFGQEHGYYGTVCPKCGKTTLRKSRRKDSESIRTALNELGQKAGILDALLRYYSVPHRYEEWINARDLPESLRPICSPLISREDIERSPLGFMGHVQEVLRDSENRMETEYKHTLSDVFTTYLYGDEFLGPAMAVFYFKENSIEALVEEENRTGRKLMPRHVFYDEITDAVENFFWNHFTRWEVLRWSRDYAGVEIQIFNEYPEQRQFAKNHDFLNILCGDLETITKSSTLLPSSITLVMKQFPRTINEQNLPTPEHPEKKRSVKRVRLKEIGAKLWEAFRKEEFRDQLSILSQRFVLEYDEKSNQTTFSKRNVSDLKVRYLNDTYKSIRSPQEWNSIRRRAPEAELRAVQEVESRIQTFKKIVSNDPEIAHSKLRIDQQARYKGRAVDFLLRGERGTGKELFAEAIHEATQDARGRDGKFLKVNCAAIPENLLENELFGHERGAFTDAREKRIGYFEAANGGTLFLDEIGELSLNAQKKLLRLIEEREIQPPGASEPRKVDVIIVFATNSNLEEMMERGTFREDLYDRINIFTHRIPPLRERKDDVPALLDHFIAIYDSQRIENPEIKPLGVTEECMQQFIKYHWPGNVRQLRNVVLRILAERKDGNRRNIDTHELPEEIVGVGTQRSEQYKNVTKENLPRKKNVTDDEIRQAMEKLNNNQSATARELGVSDRTIRRRLKQMKN